jgi:hypothetical protein
MSTEEVQTVNQAINLLVHGVQAAQKRGTYSLDEAALLYQAINTLTESTEQSALPQETEELKTEPVEPEN